MTRVLHILEALEAGVSRHVLDIVRHAERTEHEVVVPPYRVGGMTDFAATGRLRDAGATIHVVPMRRTPWAPRNAESLARLVALVRTRRPDVVHGHSTIGGLLGRTAATASGRRVPRVYTPNGIVQERIGIAAERVLRRMTDVFIAVSDSEGAHALELGLVGTDQLVVIPNGVELEPPPPVGLRARLGVAPDVPLVATVARLVPQKAPLDFVAACGHVAAAVPEARFVLIGNGTLAAEVDGAIAALGLGERFQRIDELPGAAGALGEVDVFALSSVFEGGPYAALEAMRAGIGVVLTDVVGSRDAVMDGETGLLVPPRAPSELAAAIVRLLRDGALRARLGAAAHQRVVDRFDVRDMGARLDELYAGL